ncbi:fibronectin type III domain-containing protein, partial [Microcoleus sp. SVA1_A1]|uniref:fibronectin type III domain-containing protein n=1 Tax=Microcoleus sp. SVA1_A1 TaxID=2818946 RepID=UPI002FD441AF
MHDRNKSSDQLRDTLCAIRANTTWYLNVGPGIFSVYVCVGDSGYAKKHTINVEYLNYWTDVSLVPNQFAEMQRVVENAQGDSFLTINNGASPTLETHINFVEVTRQLPPQIVGFANQTGANQIIVSWVDNSTAEQALQLWRYSAVDGYVLLASAPNITSHVDNSAYAQGVQYQYFVRAVYENGLYHDGVSVYTLTDYIPTPPTSFAAAAVSSSQINLAWTNTAANAQYFDILRSGDGVNYGLVTTLGSSATSFTDTGLASNTIYYYKVQVRSRFYSSQSGAIAATTFGPPAAPSNLTASSNSPTQVNLSWSDNSNNETGFHLQRRAGSGNYDWFLDLPANTTSYVNTGLSAGVTYTYKILAGNAVGVSAFSNEASATTQGIPVIVNPPVGSPSPS